MNKNILTIAISSIITFSANAEYLLKQPVKSGIADSFVVEKSGLYEFSSHTFTNCGKIGRTGPTLAECRASYNTSWDEDGNVFKMDSYQGYQQWVVPETATYTIKAIGASGGLGYNQSVAGKGAIIQGDFDLTEGDIITMLVGQMGENNQSESAHGGGGGGASWVSKGSNPANGELFIVAGGGGGNHSTQWGGTTIKTMELSINAQLNNTGDNSRSWGNYRGDGASYSFDGQTNNGSAQNSKSFKSGGLGGDDVDYCYSIYGGFGGGGKPHCHNGGGGGGYTGGAGGYWADSSGEGGGSYNTGINKTAVVNSTYGHGSVTITKK